MFSIALIIVTVGLLILKWMARLRSLPPGPILPLMILRHLWWSKFYGKNDMEIILTLKEEYGGIFSVDIGYKRVVIMSDFDKAKVRTDGMHIT